MMMSFSGKSVLITGGTRGIGLATGLAFGELGAQCILTHRWGSVEEREVKDAFSTRGAPEPRIIEADASQDDETVQLASDLRLNHRSIDVFVSNVAFGSLVSNPADYSRRGLLAGIEYSAWPIVSYTQALARVFEAPPRYIIGLSSDGPDHYIPNYDLIACAKAVLETLSKYLAYHYAAASRVNVVRAGMVRTASLEATLGSWRVDKLHMAAPEQFIKAESVAKVIVALCSGYMDAVTGQVIHADRGLPFSYGGKIKEE